MDFMSYVHISLKKEIDNSYDVLIQPGCLSIIAKDLKQRNYAHKYAIITDSTVRSLYGEQLLRGLKSEGLDACMLDFPAGEASKNRETINSAKVMVPMVTTLTKTF